jgi:hypothetical protein
VDNTISNGCCGDINPSSPLDATCCNSESGSVLEERRGFTKDLKSLINSYCIENESNTPDWVLVNYIRSCLDVFAAATAGRDKYYGINCTGTSVYINGE